MEAKNKKISINVISSGLQVIVIGIVYFFLYKYLLATLKIEVLGVWSVVLATTSLANLANFGISTSVIRYVALYAVDFQKEKMKQLVFTSVVFLASLFIIFALCLYPFAELILKYVVHKNQIDTALMLVPYSLICLVINAITGVYASVLDGLQKNYLRSIIYTISALILLGGTLLFTPYIGLRGVALSQVIQSLFSLVFCFVIVVKQIGYNPFSWNWSNSIFKEIFSYGMKFQVLSITAMFYDPITKLLLAKFGGLAFTGYYEMASRLISQVKGVVVSANQSLIPVLIEKGKESWTVWFDFYKKTFHFVYMFTLFFMTSLILISNIASLLWIGHIEPIFNAAVFLLALATFINLLTSPAYFSNLADGRMNILMISQLSIGAVNLLFGVIFGFFWGGVGVIIAWLTAILVGAVIILKNYQLKRDVKWSELIYKTNIIKFTIISSLVLIVKYLVSENFGTTVSFSFQSVLILIYTTFFVILFFKNYLPSFIINRIKLKKSVW
ncbi:MAG: oligosaccharide flippase family protein [Bacteroidales bacterium]|nr:oligosaccharide flippase family protein [Bacteroidales bacterium]